MRCGLDRMRNPTDDVKIVWALKNGVFVCDESKQALALASFRAFQKKHTSIHVPLLYMGMEYLRR